MSQFRAWASNTFLNIAVNGQAPAKPVSEAPQPVDAETPPPPSRGASDQSWEKWQEVSPALYMTLGKADGHLFSSALPSLCFHVRLCVCGVAGGSGQVISFH